MPKTTPEQNKALVLESCDTLFNKRDYAAAERFWSKDTAAEQGGKKVFHKLQRWIRLSANDRPKPAGCEE